MAAVASAVVIMLLTSSASSDPWVSVPLQLGRGWYFEVPSSARGLLVQVAGGVEDPELMPFTAGTDPTWTDVAPTIVGTGVSIPLAATPVLGSYFWLAWNTTPATGQYQLSYQSWNPRDRAWQPASFDFEVVEPSPPPQTLGTLTVIERCGYGPAAGFGNDVFHIMLGATAIISPEAHEYSSTILAEWSLALDSAELGAVPSNGAAPMRPTAEGTLHADLVVLCDPYAFFGKGTDEPEKPRWVRLVGLAAGQDASPEPLQHRIELSCSICDWEAAGAPPEAVASWRRAFDTTTATEVDASTTTANEASSSAPEAVSEPCSLPRSPSPASPSCATARHNPRDATWLLQLALIASVVLARRGLGTNRTSTSAAAT